jgi:SHS2 domain-containing protein
MPFKYVDDIATADCAVEIEGGTLSQLFEDAAMALVTRMTDPSTVLRSRSWNLELTEGSIEMLFYDWLSELIYLKDVEAALFSEFRVDEISDGPQFRLRARVSGEPIDHDRHDIAVDIKAVTMHMFRVERVGDIWKAFVVFDL